MDKIKKIKEDFINVLNSDRLAHAYLFFGDNGEIINFSKSLANFLETGEFSISEKFLNDSIFINSNEGGNIGIDEAKKIQNFLFQCPIISKKRVAVIEDGDALTDEAQSALLKIIEEPPKDSLIIIVAKSAESVLPTISSRVQKQYFPTLRNLNFDANSEDLDEIFKKTLIDLRKDLRQNSGIASKVLERIVSFKRYNTNNKLQLKVINNLLKKKNS